MENKDLMSGVANAVTGKERFRITIPITVQQLRIAEAMPRLNIWDRISGKSLPVTEPLPEIETERELVIYPCKVGNMYRIASAALSLPEEIVKGSLAESILPLIENQEMQSTIIYIVAAGIQNNHLEPEQSLIDFLHANLDHEDMTLLLHHTLDNLGMDSFLNSIVLVRGTVNILNPETSPTDGSE